MRKRWRCLGIILGILMAALMVRTAYIQILGKEDLSAAAHTQQRIVLDGADSRGTIYDRNGTPLAGGQQEYIYIIEAEKFDGETGNALKQVNAQEVPNEGGMYRVFTSKRYSKKIGTRLICNSEAYILEAGRRYQKKQPAVHLIGYVTSKDGSGASGLELQYDKELSLYNKKVATVADVKGHLLRGTGLAITTAQEKDTYVKDGITTTLDFGLQTFVEDVLEKTSYNGAAVVTKVDTGEIVASASTPTFDPSAVSQYMESSNGELINKVTQGQYPPGSVFKIVVAAAALEAGISVDSTYTCSGSEVVNGRTVKCSTGGKSGHGTITLTDAFAKSCNCAFIQLGKQMGAEAILQMAQNLGFGQAVLDGYPGEKSGNLSSLEQVQGTAIANLSIGQGQLLASPLQIAKMTNIVANAGVDVGLHIVSQQDENEMESQCFSAETAQRLLAMMRQTMLIGTGSNLESNLSIAAKTGSAESTQGGIEVVHGWMTGCVPANEPQYTITVFMENGRSGSGSAGPVFQEIAQYISDSYLLETEMNF